MSGEDIKLAIRKRLFLAKVRKGDSLPRFGIMWCRECRGRGYVCNEFRSEDGKIAMAAMGDCLVCGGQSVVAESD